MSGAAQPEEREPVAKRPSRPPKKKKDTKNKERNLTENKVYHTILYSIQLTGRIRVMKKWFHVFFKNRWGRGQPDDIGAINLGDEKFDPDSDKKPRAGQILWIRGLTRLQTQVTIPIFLSFSLSIYLSLSLCLSLSHSLIISSFNKNSIFSRFLSIHENRNEKPNKKKKPPPDPTGSGGETTRVTYGLLERLRKILRTLSFLFLFFVFFFPFF